MIFRLAWKEYREGRGIWLAMAVLGAGAVFVLPLFLEVLDQSDPQQHRQAVSVALVVLAATYGLVAGAMLLAGEREARTLTFLDILTASRRRLWAAKLQVGIVLALAQGFVLAGLFVAGRFPPAPGSRSVQLYNLLPLLTLEALVWGLLSSAFCRTVLAGASVGAALYALGWLVLATWATAGGGNKVYLLGRLLLDSLALFGSYAVFRGRSRWRGNPNSEILRNPKSSEIRNPKPEIRSPEEEPPLLSSRFRISDFGFRISGFGFRISEDFGFRISEDFGFRIWWLAWRQGRAEFGIAATAMFVLGLGFASHVLMLWPLATLLVGIVYGTGVWGREQADASYRFLSDQRLPPGRVWLVKTLFGAAAALLTVACGLLGAMIHLGLAYARQPDAARAMMGLLRLDVLLFAENAPAVALVWLANGFAAGQLLGMLCRKTLVAVMTAVPASLGMVGVWLPSLISGGLPAWQVYVVPVIVLAACRLLLWSWETDNLLTRRPVVTLAACGGLAAVAVMGGLVFRVLGVPNVGAPFDVEEFRHRVAAPEENEAGQRMRQALAELTTHRKVVGAFPRAEEKPARPTHGPEDDFATRILREGWEAAPPGLGAWLDRVYAGAWSQHFAAAAQLPTGILFDPRRPLGPRALQEVAESGAPLILALRSIQLLEAKKNAAAALDQVKQLLALSRALRNKAFPRVYLVGLEAEDYALLVLWLWSDQPQPAALARDALDTLARHEAATPPVTDALKADYLSAYQRLVDFFQYLPRAEGADEDAVAWRSQLFTFAQLTPWERVRAERLINIAYAAHFAGQPPTRRRRNPTAWEIALQAPSFSGIRLGAVKGLCRLRAMRLQFALALFEQQKGRPAGELTELVPDCLAAVPLDPFTGKSFGYRISPGEQWEGRLSRGPAVKVARGQGVLWSGGPDRKNPAAVPQARVTEWTFLVPLWAKH